MDKDYQPIVEGDKLILSNLLSYININKRVIFRVTLYVNIIFTLFFFLKTDSYKSEVSFYTNYDSDSNSSFLNSLTSSLSPESEMKFSISNYLNSEKFLNKIAINQYNIAGQLKSLVDLWGPGYNDFLQINPINIIILFNESFMYNNQLTDYDKKLSFSKKVLLKNITHSKDDESSLHKISITVKKYPNLSKEIIEHIYQSIITYANEINNIKASEKVAFISKEVEDIKNKLKFSQNKMVAFLNTNQQITSPNLIIERERINTEIKLNTQLYISLSDQLALAKIDANDNTSSLFLLDLPNVKTKKTGMSLIEGYILMFFISSIFYTISIIYRDRKKLFN